MSQNPKKIHIVGGGMAGTEAAWQCLQLGAEVFLYEMRPKVMTDAHQTGDFAEMVCSNTLKSTDPDSAPGLLKNDMRAFGSLILDAAEKSKIPAGGALGVDRIVFSKIITETLEHHPRFQRIDREVTNIPSQEELEDRNECWIIATGPLTSPALTPALGKLSGDSKRLFFYDAIAPILSADSLDFDHAFFGNRYDQEADDYLNLPMNKEEYENFIDAIIAAEKMPLHEFETTSYFESCLPIEVMVERGRETPRFGPMKPVGFTDPKTGHRPWAVVQLRRENASGTMFSMVGFQTKMKWPDQKRVFSMLAAMKNAEFLRFGSVHRNTYVHGPAVLNSDLSFKLSSRVFLAGQVTGVEGYTESAAIGLLAGRAAMAKVAGKTFVFPPADTILGALAHYVTKGGLGDFQPMNANLGLLPPITKQKGVSKAERRGKQALLARQSFENYFADVLTSSANSAGLSEAPPTNPPSISG